MLGAALGQVGFGRRLGGRATAVAMLSAELPDVDFLIHSATDPLLGVELHRHFTHSFAFSPVIAGVAALPWLFRAAQRPHRIALLLCGLVGCWSHILLDSCTSYGTTFLLPLSRERFGWDLISIIDPIFTLALLAGVVANAVRSRRRAMPTRRWATVALLFAAAYLALGAAQKARALSAQATLARGRGHRIERTEMMPTMANHLVWRSLYVHSGRVHSDRIRVPWLGAITVRKGASLPVVTRADLSPAEAARDRRLGAFERFSWFADGWLARAPDAPAIIGDMRYSLSSQAFDPIWGIRFAAPDAPVEVEWVNRSRDRKLSIGELWAEIVGKDPGYTPL